jgi:glutamyl-tRNA synthetase
MAPSPTGYLHLGNARTALFVFLFARANDGTFVLRMDDTDVERGRPEFETAIYGGMRWLGMNWDEGPDIGGPFGPYRQSERMDIYRDYAARLIASGHAYRCYCTKEELAEERRRAEAEHRPYVYSRRCLNDPPAGRKEFAVRFKVPEGEVSFLDLIHGELRFDTGLIGDPVILRSDATPVYNFSSPIDDALMDITHVVRGDDHISNTPIQILITEAIGHSLPEAYAHVPQILMPDRSKMSKRKHPEAALEYFQNSGYLAEAMVNFLALLGWNPGTEQEIFTLSELITAFSLDRVQKSGAIFDRKKLDWLNGQHIRRLDDDELARRLQPFLPELSEELVRRAAPALKERLTRLDEAKAMLEYLWVEPPPAQLNGDATQYLRPVHDALAAVDWTPEAIEQALEELLERLGTSRNKLFTPIRACVTGSKISPPIHHTLALLPKAEALARLDRCSP